MSGKLYVIESGSDASGKHTQTKLLYQKISEKNLKVKMVEFPNYDSDSSFAVKMYLKGDFADNPSDINAYTASTFFAMDRYITFTKELKRFYNSGGIIIADRYTTSNMVYQGAKIDDDKERQIFLDWLFELEFKIYSLPIPTEVFYLDVPFAISSKLLDSRRKSEEIKDIHEEDKNYLEKVHRRAKNIALNYNWNIIDCTKDGEMLSIEDINAMIMERIKL